MSLPEPCHQCGVAADVLLGTQAWCHECAEAFLAPIREKVALRQGLVRRLYKAPGHGPGMWYLECQTCEATWVGEPHEACQWCIERTQRLVEDQRSLLLKPPAETSSVTWARQLAHAQAAGIITEAEAHSAIRSLGGLRG